VLVLLPLKIFGRPQCFDLPLERQGRFVCLDGSLYRLDDLGWILVRELKRRGTRLDRLIVDFNFRNIRRGSGFSRYRDLRDMIYLLGGDCVGLFESVRNLPIQISKNRLSGDF
jgi:hypothetical protein